MKLFIMGLANSGKTTIFNVLTGKKIETNPYPSTDYTPQLGTVKVPDYRIDYLAEILKPKKITYPSIELVDFMSFKHQDTTHNFKVIQQLKDPDAIIQVVRAFEDPKIPHPIGDINPMRDVNIFESELMFHDFELVDKRLEKIKEASKKGKKIDELQYRLLNECKEILESNIPLRKANFKEEDEKALRYLQFITNRPQIVVLNIYEKDINTEKISILQNEVEKYYTQKGSPEKIKVLSLCANIEMEISHLNPEDSKAFLEDFGLQEPASKKLIRASYEILELISFITIDNELKAWPIKKGTNALRAASKVHTDIAKGFIRAEIINYQDFLKYGSISAAKEKGLVRLEGKSYEIQDGDIIYFRFNI
ncbi:MAG: redox-regulated ATPase YchF [Thermodesulfovibrionales bacterium]|nr:redox-regulated ATPase YchF [Thermodesulfovibrionales bacterium]